MPRPERPLALITGANRGIGRAIATALAADHDLLLVARNAGRLDELRAALQPGGANIRVLSADLTNERARQGLTSQLSSLEQPVGVLVNNAGIAHAAPLGATDDEAWERSMTLNAFAPFTLCKAVLPGMKRLGWGRIVNIASTAALKGYRFTTAYSASKGALVAMTRAIAAEVTKLGVTVNAICPGFTDTDIVADAVANVAHKTGRNETEARHEFEQFSPLGRLIQPDEIAALVRYLVSDAAATVHGQALIIDGGETSL